MPVTGTGHEREYFTRPTSLSVSPSHESVTLEFKLGTPVVVYKYLESVQNIGGIRS